MAWSCSGNTNVELIDNMFKAGLIQSPIVVSVSEEPLILGILATFSCPEAIGDETSRSCKLRS